MANKPHPSIEEAFLEPVSSIIRRAEIYEYDGKTPWKPELWTRLIDGSVTCDHDADERRTFEVTLDNFDSELDPEAGNLWYDKVFKIIYGIELNQQAREPKVIIAEEYDSIGQALAIKGLLAKAGIKYVHYNPLVSTYADVEDFDVLISVSSDHTRKLTLLNEAFAKGKSILTLGVNAVSAELPYIIAGAALVISTDNTGVRTFTKSDAIHDLTVGWNTWNVTPPHSYRKINAPASGAVIVGYTSDLTNGLSPGIVARAAFGGARWVHLQQSKFEAGVFNNDSDRDNCANFLGAAIRWLDTFVPQAKWETQLGEFVSDSISFGDDQGYTIRVNGRDYAKRCLKSKLAAATAFPKTARVEDVIKTLALNSGISKFKLLTTNKILDIDKTYERDTSRWEIMKDLATANNYELYFDAFGYLTMTEMSDPLLTPPSLELTIGPGGNLIKRGKKTSDARLFNHVVVVGESSDSTIPPVYAEAKNENPNSPSNIEKLGDRVIVHTTPLVTKITQAQELANSLLSVAGLEEFELTFDSVLLPWVEVGEILEMIEDAVDSWGPSRFLISSINFPLDLGAMTGVGKRITKVA